MYLVGIPLNGRIKLILTHLAYIANGLKTCYIVQQFHWVNEHDVTLCRFDAILK